MVSADQSLWIADGASDQVMKHSLDSTLQYAWTSGTNPGSLWRIHRFPWDSAGNFYAAETLSGRTQKFTLTSGADASKIMVTR
jgi:hypothetical protein